MNNLTSPHVLEKHIGKTNGRNGIWIPTLCHDARVEEAYGGCRMCMVVCPQAAEIVDTLTTTLARSRRL